MLEAILFIIFTIITLGVTFLSYYLSIKNKISQEALKAINTAEDSELDGAEKKRLAVEQVKKLVPTVLRPFITDDLINTLVQMTFDEIKAYAIKQSTK